MAVAVLCASILCAFPAAALMEAGGPGFFEVTFPLSHNFLRNGPHLLQLKYIAVTQMPMQLNRQKRLDPIGLWCQSYPYRIELGPQ